MTINACHVCLEFSIYWLILFVCLFSYPYSEDSSQGKQYMNTRCPAWCDRILLSASARDLVLKVSLNTPLVIQFSRFRLLLEVRFLRVLSKASPPPRQRLTLYFYDCIVLEPCHPPRPLSLHRWKDEVSVNINLES